MLDLVALFNFFFKYQLLVHKFIRVHQDQQSTLQTFKMAAPIAATLLII